MKFLYGISSCHTEFQLLYFPASIYSLPICDMFLYQHFHLQIVTYWQKFFVSTKNTMVKIQKLYRFKKNNFIWIRCFSWLPNSGWKYCFIRKKTKKNFLASFITATLKSQNFQWNQRLFLSFFGREFQTNSKSKVHLQCSIYICVSKCRCPHVLTLNVPGILGRDLDTPVREVMFRRLQFNSFWRRHLKVKSSDSWGHLMPFWISYDIREIRMIFWNICRKIYG